MPELPEVETIKKGLEEHLVGKKIIDVQIKLHRIVTGEVKFIKNSKVKAVRRAGKGLIIDLDNDFSIAIHIKLTGQLIYRDAKFHSKLSEKVGDELPNKWTHVIFKLDKNSVLYYNDIRQFGWIKIVKTSEVGNLPFFRELGPEPFNGLTLDLFRKILSKSSTKIKPLLMDQKKIGGIGNIYANDALWLSKIDPRRAGKTLSSFQQKELYNATLVVLKRGLKYGGASELNFVNALGQEGGYQKHFLTYAQDGQPCARKDGIIKKIKLAGRGTYFCEKCQK